MAGSLIPAQSNLMKNKPRQHDEDPFVTGLKVAMEATGWKAAPLSSAAGMGETAIRDLLRKGSSPKISTAIALARALDNTVDGIIALGTGAEVQALTPAPDHDHAVMVNVWDVAASAGDGSIVPAYESLAYRLAFPPDYLRSITSTPPDRLQIISVKGRSMLTTLDEDDVVMIDTTKRHIGYDGIFVIRLDETLHVKRIGRSSTRGKVRIISDNKAEFPEFERAMDEVEVLGRVIWAGKRM